MAILGGDSCEIFIKIKKYINNYDLEILCFETII